MPPIGGMPDIVDHTTAMFRTIIILTHTITGIIILDIMEAIAIARVTSRAMGATMVDFAARCTLRTTMPMPLQSSWAG